MVRYRVVILGRFPPRLQFSDEFAALNGPDYAFDDTIIFVDRPILKETTVQTLQKLGTIYLCHRSRGPFLCCNGLVTLYPLQIYGTMRIANWQTRSQHEMKSKTQRDYFTTGDAARLGEVSNQAIDAAVRDGRLPVACRTVGGVRLFRRADVERFVKERSPKREEREKDPQ